MNRTICQLIRCYNEGRQNNWDEHLQILAGAIRSSVNRSTQYTPNRLMLGKEVNQPADLLFTTNHDETEIKSYPKYVKDLRENLYEAHEMARKCLKTSQHIQKRDFDHKVYYHRLEVGDIVYRLNHATKIKQSTKLKAPWEGPYVVTKVLSPVLVKIKNKKREFVVHHNNVQARPVRCVPLWARRVRNSILSPDHPNFDSETPSDPDLDKSLGFGFLFEQDGLHDTSVSDRDNSNDIDRKYDSIPDLDIPQPITRTGRQSRKPQHLIDYTY